MDSAQPEEGSRHEGASISPTHEHHRLALSLGKHVGEFIRLFAVLDSIEESQEKCSVMAWAER